MFNIDFGGHVIPGAWKPATRDLVDSSVDFNSIFNTEILIPVSIFLSFFRSFLIANEKGFHHLNKW